jgi:hypothetical protein
MPGTLQMHMRTRGIARNPAALAVRPRNHPIEGQRQFERDVGSTQGLPQQEPGHAPARLAGEHTLGHGNSRSAHPGETLASRPFVRIG